MKFISKLEMNLLERKYNMEYSDNYYVFEQEYPDFYDYELVDGGYMIFFNQTEHDTWMTQQ